MGNLVATVRDIGTIEREINGIKEQVARLALSYAVEIGRRLCEAKDMLPHGEWGTWVKEKAGFSQSTANNMMRLFEEYGADQFTIFGAAVNSQALANLSYTKAISLLSLPADEREEFAKSVDAESLSTRELEKAVREKVAAEKAAAECAGQLEEARAEAERQAGVIERLEVRAAKDEADRKAAQAEKERLEKAVADAEKRLAAAKGAGEEALRNAEAVGEAKGKSQAEADAAAELEKLKAQVGKAEADMKTAEQHKKFLEDKLALAEEAKAQAEEAARKMRQNADPNVTKFKMLFEDVKNRAQQMKICINAVAGTDPEMAEKMEGAMKSMAKVLGGAD